MELRIERFELTADSTIGRLYVDGAFECYTLEDTVRSDPNPETPQNEGKVYGRTAIPAGRYRVSVTYSPRFKARLPLIENVPGYVGVRIHAGNTAADTEGCILVGSQYARNFIGKSRLALVALQTKIDAAAARLEACWCTIVNVVKEAA